MKSLGRKLLAPFSVEQRPDMPRRPVTIAVVDAQHTVVVDDLPSIALARKLADLLNAIAAAER